MAEAVTGVRGRSRAVECCLCVTSSWGAGGGCGRCCRREAPLVLPGGAPGLGGVATLPTPMTADAQRRGPRPSLPRLASPRQAVALGPSTASRRSVRGLAPHRRPPLRGGRARKRLVRSLDTLPEPARRGIQCAALPTWRALPDCLGLGRPPSPRGQAMRRAPAVVEPRALAAYRRVGQHPEAAGCFSAPRLAPVARSPTRAPRGQPPATTTIGPTRGAANTRPRVCGRLGVADARGGTRARCLATDSDAMCGAVQTYKRQVRRPRSSRHQHQLRGLIPKAACTASAKAHPADEMKLLAVAVAVGERSACEPATYQCLDSYEPGWQVCDVNGKWVVRGPAVDVWKLRHG